MARAGRLEIAAGGVLAVVAAAYSLYSYYLFKAGAGTFYLNEGIMFGFISAALFFRTHMVMEPEAWLPLAMWLRRRCGSKGVAGYGMDDMR